MIIVRKKSLFISLVMACILTVSFLIYKASLPKLNKETVAIVNGVPIKTYDF